VSALILNLPVFGLAGIWPAVFSRWQGNASLRGLHNFVCFCSAVLCEIGALRGYVTRSAEGKLQMSQSEIDAVRVLLGSKPAPGRLASTSSAHRGSRGGVAGRQRRKIRRSGYCGTAGEWSIAPGSDASRVLLFFHGGGYCSGSILSHRRLVTEAGRAAKTRTLAIEYRLAPEHPFPAALDDTLAAWNFCANAAARPNILWSGGDSAGGGLTIALINRLRAAGEHTPGCAWLLSPWTDLTLSGSTLATKDAVDPIIHKAYLAELIEAYLPADVDRKDPRVFSALCRSEGFFRRR